MSSPRREFEVPPFSWRRPLLGVSRHKSSSIQWSTIGGEAQPLDGTPPIGGPPPARIIGKHRLRTGQAGSHEPQVPSSLGQQVFRFEHTPFRLTLPDEGCPWLISKRIWQRSQHQSKQGESRR